MQTGLELYQLVAPLAGLGIWERNFKSDNFYWSGIIREILEVDADFTPPLEEAMLFYKDSELVRDLITETMETGQPKSAELELITAKGKMKWVKLHLKAAFEDGECVSIYGTLQDITHEVNLRKQSEEREQRFFQAFTHAPIGMAMVSLSGGWIKVNNSLCKLLGYTEDELLQRTFQELTHPEDLETDLGLLKQVLDGQTNAYTMEKRYYHMDGHTIWALLSVAVVRDEAKKPLYFVSQIKDITESKRHIETIREQNDRLLNFAHIVSHNLRSHTGNIQMLTDMILEEPDQAEKDSLTAMLSENAGNLLETLDQLNEVVKVHNNGLANRKILNLYDEVTRVLHILSGSVLKAGASIDVQIPRDTRALFNPAYLESILINLLSNSIRYRQPGRILEVNITAVQDNEKVTLKVRDNGLGIDLALHGHKLFGMYKTFHGNNDARGMGLFLVKNQVEAMGGNISADSKPGNGTTFTIEFYKN